MAVFLQSVLSGILVGGIYALIGIGLTIIFGVMRIINFAHGELMMLGMYLTWMLFAFLHVDPFLSIVIVAPVMFLWGAFLQKALINRVLNALPQNQILLTIGLGLVMSNTVMLVATSDYRILTTTYSSSSYSLFGLSVPQSLLYAFLITAGITVALYWFLLKTDTGQAIRATAQDREAAQLMGINVRRMSVLAFGLGAALAGTAGALISPTYYIFPQVGSTFTLKAFVIVVLGGMGSVVGASIGALLIGLAEQFGLAYAPTYSVVFTFVIMVVALAFRPRGLMGKRA